MDIIRADNLVFGILQEIDLIQRAYGEEPFVDYDLSSLLPDSFKGENFVSPRDVSARIESIRNNLEIVYHLGGPGTDKLLRDEAMLPLYREAYKNLFNIHDCVEYAHHPLGQVFKRQIRSKIGWLRNKIVVPEQALDFFQLHENCSQIDMSLEDVYLEKAMIIACDELEEAIKKLGLDINACPRPEIEGAAARARSTRIDACLRWINNYSRQNMMKMDTAADLHLVKSQMEGHVKGVYRFLKESQIWGNPNFTFDVVAQESGNDGFLAWLVSDGRNFKQLLKIKIIDMLQKNIGGVSSGSAISSHVLLYNGIHEASHMWAIGIHANYTEMGKFPQGGTMLKSFALNNVIDTKAFFDESIGAACPLVWGVQGLPEAYVKITVWGRMLQKLTLGRVLQHMVRHGKASAEAFLEHEGAFTGMSVEAAKGAMNGLLNVQGNTYEPNITLIYPHCIVEMIRLYGAVGKENFSNIIADSVVAGYQDAHTFLDFINTRGKPYGYEAVCKPIKLPDPPHIAHLQLKEIPVREPVTPNNRQHRLFSNEFH